MRTYSAPESGYIMDSIMAVTELRENETRRRLVIVDSGKSTLAYELCAEMGSCDSDLYCRFAMLTSEDGELHEHVLISRRDRVKTNDISLAPDGFWADRAYDWITRAAVGLIDRRELQMRLGWALGYSIADIKAFRDSDVAKTCPCDCCGGPASAQVPERNDEAHIRRTMYHAK